MLPYPAGPDVRPGGESPGPRILPFSARAVSRLGPTPMTSVRSERLLSRHRLTAAADFAALRAEGSPVRGALCLLVALARPGAPTRVGFVASKRGVGGAVERNRARRRLREIVRRRWARLPEEGWLLMFVAHRATPTAPHQDLASDVERVLATAGLLAPLPPNVAPERDRP